MTSPSAINLQKCFLSRVIRIFRTNENGKSSRRVHSIAQCRLHLLPQRMQVLDRPSVTDHDRLSNWHRNARKPRLESAGRHCKPSCHRRQACDGITVVVGKVVQSILGLLGCRQKRRSKFIKYPLQFRHILVLVGPDPQNGIKFFQHDAKLYRDRHNLQPQQTPENSGSSRSKLDGFRVLLLSNFPSLVRNLSCSFGSLTRKPSNPNCSAGRQSANKNPYPVGQVPHVRRERANSNCHTSPRIFSPKPILP